MKKVVLSVFPNKFVWLIGVDVEFVLPCRSDPLGTHRSAGQIVQRVLAKANKTSTVLLCLTRAFLNLFLRKNPIPAQQIAYIYG